MSVAIFGLLFFLLGHTESSPSFELLDGNSNKLYDSDWQCDTICLGSGGKARFDRENKICKCTMDKNTDEIDALLMKKNAFNTGVGVASQYNYLKKRDIPEGENFETDKVGGKKFKKFDLKKFKPKVPKMDKFKKFLPKSKKKIESKSRNAKHAKEDSDAKQRFKEMQDKFKDRIEGLTWKLPKLKQRSAFKEASAKANNDLKKKKEDRRQKFSLKSKNIVGQPAPKITAEKPEEINPPQEPSATSNKIPTAPNKIPSEDKIPAASNKLPTFNIFGQKGIFNSNDNGGSKNNLDQEINANNYNKQEIIKQPSNLYNNDDGNEDDVK